MAREQKQHHYIPICYSKAFANGDGYIFIRDCWTGSVFPSKPGSALKQSYLYTQPVHAEGRFDNAIENFFSRAVEASWPSLVSKIQSQQELGRSEWSQVIQFLLSLRIRVPNTIKATLELLRETVTDISDQLGPLPETIKKAFYRLNPNWGIDVRFSDVVRSGLININIDPHRAITSFANLIRNCDAVTSIRTGPVFYHNLTDIDFICSDNPVIYHQKCTDNAFIEPYSYSTAFSNELIMPITSRIVLLMNGDRRNNQQHFSMRSRRSVESINRKLSKYSDRYIFGRSQEQVEAVDFYPDLAPIPVLEHSSVGNGVVHRIEYTFGPPIKTRNKWRYAFEQAL